MPRPAGIEARPIEQIGDLLDICDRAEAMGLGIVMFPVEDVRSLLHWEAACDELHRVRWFALLEAEDALRLAAKPPTIDPTHGALIADLGRRIGFGALMTSASASWAQGLGRSGGEFVAGPCRATVDKVLAAIRAADTYWDDPVEPPTNVVEFPK